MLFIAGAVVLRAGSVATWAFFPPSPGLQQIARVAIPLAFAGCLVALNRWCLQRDGFERASLGLEWRRLGWFAIGAAAMTIVIMLIAGALWLQVPFHWERGSLGLAPLAWQFAEYMAGNFAEELIFRGYLLLVLARHLGFAPALAITGILFGFFHLPGLSGLAAVKMVCTTAAGSLLFAAGFLLSRSLWTAVGMHVWGNLLLHQLLGLSAGTSAWRVVWERTWPADYDPAFVTWMMVTVPCAALLLVVFWRRKVLDWNPSRGA